ncbi:hypothetical protein [Nostoc sp. CCY 9925]|uniref:hypothetical protein n=1 Tax=Nostoc sp. CCY 9925 TaxID=3103865 RepID=UPI0039C6BC7F
MKIFEVKNKFALLLKLTAYVGLGFLVMLLITGGRASAFIVGLSVILGIGFVIWSENKRIHNQ